MRFFKRNSEAKGLIGYYKLSDWWFSVFTEDERKHLEKLYTPFRGGGDATSGSKGILTEAQISESGQTVSMFLNGLASFLGKDRELASRVLKKAEEESLRTDDVMGLHFIYLAMIEIHYRDRDSIAGALELAIEACEKQIALAPKAVIAFNKEYQSQFLPSHTGFKQLAIIREKQGNYKEAIRISTEAKKQGWKGDWDKRIERYEKNSNRSIN